MLLQWSLVAKGQWHLSFIQICPLFMFNDPVVHHGQAVCPLYRGVLCEMITVVDSEKAPIIAREVPQYTEDIQFRQRTADSSSEVHKIPSEGKQSVTLTPVHKIWSIYNAQICGCIMTYTHLWDWYNTVCKHELIGLWIVLHVGTSLIIHQFRVITTSLIMQHANYWLHTQSYRHGSIIDPVIPFPLSTFPPNSHPQVQI
jgi:hypothetical protein